MTTELFIFIPKFYERSSFLQYWGKFLLIFHIPLVGLSGTTFKRSKCQCNMDKSHKKPGNIIILRNSKKCWVLNLVDGWMHGMWWPVMQSEILIKCCPAFLFLSKAFTHAGTICENYKLVTGECTADWRNFVAVVTEILTSCYESGQYKNR